MGNIIKCLKNIIKYFNCHKEKDRNILATYDPMELNNLSENGETIYSKYIISDQNIQVSYPLINV